MNKQFTHICYTQTIYSLFLFLLMEIENKEQSLFIFSSNIPQNISNKFKNKVILDCRFKKKSKLYKYLEKWKINKILKNNLKNVSKNAKSYGYIFSDCIGNILKDRYEFNILEDGLANYNLIGLKKYKKNIKEFLLGGSLNEYESHGLDKKTKNIYLTGLGDIPKEVENKVIKIDIKALWNSLSIKNKEVIKNLLGFSNKESFNKREIILFTQPISEDKFISENEKIKIYSKIILEYGEKNIILKPHPREKTKYEEIFKNVLVLKGHYPAELLNCMGENFKKAVTLFSTAALNMENKIEIDFYGTEVHPNIFKAFGSCDHIMKRNKKLKEN